MQCMSKEECNTNKKASEPDLKTTVKSLKALTDAGLFDPG